MVSRLSNTGPQRAGFFCACAALAAMAALALAAPAALGQCQYQLGDGAGNDGIIQAPPCPFGGPPATIGRGMNNLGHVAGFHFQCFVTADEAFYWTPETGLVTMPRPNDVHTARANDINDHGLVVGNQLFTGDGDMPIGWRGFVYDIATGEYTYLEPKYEGGSSWANAINNAGIVAGSRTIDPDGGQSPFNAVIWDTNTGEVTDLGVMNGPNSSALTINEIGNAGGWSGAAFFNGNGFVFTADGVEQLDGIPDGESSQVAAINENDKVVGSGVLQGDFLWRAFVWSDGQFTVIPPVDNYIHSRATSITRFNQIGLFYSAPGQVHEAFIYDHNGAHSLNSLLDDEFDSFLGTTVDINNGGQILAIASTKAVLLSPVDVPFTDLNYDCRTDIHDLLLLIVAWGECQDEDDCPPDFTGSGSVGVGDLLILLGNWSLD